MSELFITTNGPGEMATWVTPVVARIKEQDPSIRISLFILPCRFATGTEYETALKIKGIDHVFKSNEFFKRLVNLPFKPDKKGSVLFLGGDLLWALLLKWRFGYQSIAYTEGATSFKSHFDHFFLRDVDGDLMYSFFESYKEDKTLIDDLSKKQTIVFFPGSRPAQFKHLHPFFKEVAKLLPKYQCIFNISDFISDDVLSTVTRGKSQQSIRHRTVELMKSATLAVTIPGTNNIQLSYLNTPALIVFPFNFHRTVHFKGAGGAIMNLPILRLFLKKWALQLLNKRVNYTALVNTKANREIYPELRGMLKPQMVANRIDMIASSKEALDTIKKNCQSLDKTSTVLDKIVNAITARSSS
jgi:hypothetical protein